jgi:hypothetical protein
MCSGSTLWRDWSVSKTTYTSVLVKIKDSQSEEILTWVYIEPNVMSKREQNFGMKMNATIPKMAQIMAKSPIWTTLRTR